MNFFSRFKIFGFAYLFALGLSFSSRVLAEAEYYFEFHNQVENCEADTSKCKTQSSESYIILNNSALQLTREIYSYPRESLYRIPIRKDQLYDGENSFSFGIAIENNGLSNSTRSTKLSFHINDPSPGGRGQYTEVLGLCYRNKGENSCKFENKFAFSKKKRLIKTFNCKTKAYPHYTDRLCDSYLKSYFGYKSLPPNRHSEEEWKRILCSHCGHHQNIYNTKCKDHWTNCPNYIHRDEMDLETKLTQEIATYRHDIQQLGSGLTSEFDSSREGESLHTRLDKMEELLQEAKNLSFVELQDTVDESWPKAVRNYLDEATKTVATLRTDLAALYSKITASIAKVTQDLSKAFRKESIDPSLLPSALPYVHPLVASNGALATKKSDIAHFTNEVLSRLDRFWQNQDRDSFLQEILLWTEQTQSWARLAEQGRLSLPGSLTAFNQNRMRVEDYLYRDPGHLHEDGWFKDSPVSKKLRTAIKADIEPLAPQETNSLTRELKKLKASTLTAQQRKALELVEALVEVGRTMGQNLHSAAVAVAEAEEDRRIFRQMIGDVAIAVRDGLGSVAVSVATGSAGSAYELFVGKDLYTSTQLSTGDRVLAGADLLLTVVPVTRIANPKVLKTMASAASKIGRIIKGSEKTYKAAIKFSIPKSKLKCFAESVELYGGNIEAIGEVAAVLTKKMDFAFGKATGNLHNIERSRDMLRHLQRIGLPDSPASRKILKENLVKALNDPTSVGCQTGIRVGSIQRESLLSGPRGHVKIESIWCDNKLNTLLLLGGS